MNLLVAYESRTGTTERSATAIAEACRAGGHDVRLRALIDVTDEDVNWAEGMFYGTWTDGFIVAAVRPAMPAELAPYRMPRLDGKPVAIFCTYAVNPRGVLAIMRETLEDRGAKVVAERAFRRKDPEADTWALAGDFFSAVYVGRTAGPRPTYA